MKVTIDGVDYEVTDQVAQAVFKLQKQVKDTQEEMEKKEDELKSKDEELEAKKEEMKKTEDSYKAKLDDAKSKILTPAMIDSMVSARADLVEKARKIAPSVSVEGKDTAAIVAAVVVDRCPGVDAKSVSADYMQARFDMLCESLTGETGTLHSLDDHFSKSLKTGSPVGDADTRPLHVIAREKMIADAQKAWKGGAFK